MLQTIPLPSTAMDASCYSSRETKDAVYAQIQSDIVTLKSSILALKKFHNSLNNSARLPDELLARIFTWNLSMQRKGWNSPWIQVAAVCTSWRRVALNCPQFWSVIRHRRTSWITKVLLPRSGDVPLDINVTLFRRVTWKGFRKALEEIHRIRELAFRDEYVAPVRIDKLLSGLTDPAPILETFKVDTGSRRNVHHLPDNLFGGFAPKLRKLKLRSCIISTTSFPLISGITTLVLADLSSCTSFPQLVMLLHSTPNVETLKLKRACKFDLNGSGELVPPLLKVHVELPHLRRLVMHETVIGCGIILAHICHASRLSHLEIKPDGCDTNEAEVLGHQLAARMSFVSHLKVDYGDKLEIYGQWEETDKPPMDLEFYVLGLRSSDDRLDATKAIIRTLPLENLRSLRASCDLGSDFWLEEFGQLMDLDTVCVRNFPSEFIEAFITGMSRSELRAVLTPTASNAGDEKSVEPYSAVLAELPSVPSPLRFMALKKLQIRSWSFLSPDPDTSLLAAVLEARSMRGSTLEKLSVEQCIHYSRNVDQEVARIRQVVGSVTWDVENGLRYVSTGRQRRGTIQTRRYSATYPSDLHESSVPDSSDH